MPKPVSNFENEKQLKDKYPQWDWANTPWPRLSSEKFRLVCPEHGEFFVTLNKLKTKRGKSPCPKCSSADAGARSRTSLEEWKERLSKTWGDKIRLVGSPSKSTEKTQFECAEHGSFASTLSAICGGTNCPECARLARIKGYRETRGVSEEDFLARARDRFGDKYQYDLSGWVGVASRIIVYCPKHGKSVQGVMAHLSGSGCPKCGREVSSSKQIGTPRVPFQDFLERARNIHGDKYTYNEQTYKGTSKRIEITCPDHGVFIQRANAHLEGRGCPECACGGPSKLEFEEFVARSRTVHGDRYTYDPSTYEGAAGFTRIVCPDHGEFLQRAHSHMSGSGCRQCANLKMSADRLGVLRFDAEEFATRSEEVHTRKYTYDITTYSGVQGKVRIICPKHGEFWQTAASHLYNGKGCPKCADGGPSKGETGIAEYLEGLCTVVRNDRRIIGPKEIDILVPDYKLGVEFCGLYWHGEGHKPEQYHAHKQKLAEDAGISLVTVFEDEWADPVKRDIIKSILGNRLGISTRVGARSLTLSEVSWGQAKEFYTSNHIAGPGSPANYNYALLDAGGIVMCLSIGPGRYDRGNLELYRLSSKKGVSVPGGFSRLITMARKNISGKLVSYVDLRFGHGGAYRAVGFGLVGRTQPGYFWCNSRGERKSRHAMQKHKLRDVLPEFDPCMSEAENCRANGYWKIHDCGHLKFAIDL